MSNKWIGTNELSVTEEVKEYFRLRKLNFPDFTDAMKFLHTEIAEVYEIDLSRKDWVRNHPEDKPSFNKEQLAEELGDAIMMLIVAGISEGVDPIQALEAKMKRKLEAIPMSKVATGVAQMYGITEDELNQILEEAGEVE